LIGDEVDDGAKPEATPNKKRPLETVEYRVFEEVTPTKKRSLLSDGDSVHSNLQVPSDLSFRENVDETEPSRLEVATSKVLADAEDIAPGENEEQLGDSVDSSYYEVHQSPSDDAEEERDVESLPEMSGIEVSEELSSSQVLPETSNTRPNEAEQNPANSRPTDIFSRGDSTATLIDDTVAQAKKSVEEKVIAELEQLLSTSSDQDRKREEEQIFTTIEEQLKLDDPSLLIPTPEQVAALSQNAFEQVEDFDEDESPTPVALDLERDIDHFLAQQGVSSSASSDKDKDKKKRFYDNWKPGAFAGAIIAFAATVMTLRYLPKMLGRFVRGN
jgi:hypothetical protein